MKPLSIDSGEASKFLTKLTVWFWLIGEASEHNEAANDCFFLFFSFFNIFLQFYSISISVISVTYTVSNAHCVKLVAGSSKCTRVAKNMYCSGFAGVASSELVSGL